jgi:GGDEF domain-containing protein
MPDITQPESVKTVEPRLEGQQQGRGGARQPPQKVAATYAEAARTSTDDDRITVLGIPFEQITPATQAALAGLVSEINYLRSQVKRLERASRKAETDSGTIHDVQAFIRSLDAALAQAPAAGEGWIMILVHVPTYDDIRRSSGLLAANAALADVAQRLRDIAFARPTSWEDPATAPQGATHVTTVGYAGGGNVAALVALPVAQLDSDALADRVRTALTATGYRVGGIDMALAINVAAAVVGSGESSLLALARTDHLLLRKR